PVLHLQHPVEVPARLAEQVGDGAARFGDVEPHRADPAGEDLVGPEQLAGGDARVHDVLAVVAGIMPAPRRLDGAARARGRVHEGVGIRRARRVTGGMAVAGIGRGQVHRRSATLPVEGAHREIEDLRVDVRGDVELVAGAHAGDVQIEGAGLIDDGEVRDAHRVAGVRVGQGRPQTSGQDLAAVRGAPHRERAAGAGIRDDRELGPRRQVADLVHLDRLVQGRPGAFRLLRAAREEEHEEPSAGPHAAGSVAGNRGKITPGSAMTDAASARPDGQRVTIRDIAEHAGVSVATVSRVLNNTVPVARAKRAAVMDAVEALGYRPNVVAQELARGHTQAVGILPQGISNPFYSRLLKGVEQGLRGSAYYPLFASGEQPAEQASALELLLTHRVEALILMGGHIPDDEVLAVAKRLPVVTIGRTIRGLERRCVRVENHEGAYKATRHLRDLGHTRIVHITGLPWHGDAVARLEGYVSALRDTGVEVDPAL